MRILIVDDSTFFRRLLRELLAREPGFEIVGEAADGRQAIEMACRLKPDVITMDVEMPGLDGISATRQIMARCPTPILMISSLTRYGARATLDALEAGALDFMAKLDEHGENCLSRQAPLLFAKLRLLSGRRLGAARSVPEPARAVPARSEQTIPDAPKAEATRAVPSVGGGECARVLNPRGIVMVGASTGGPAAVQKLLQGIPASFPVPIVVVQHMQPIFTHAFAERLDRIIPLSVKEAHEGEQPLPGHVYIAPGGVHIQLAASHGKPAFSLREPQANEHYRPSVDVGLSSAAQVYRSDVLGIVLTGMGNDGVLGARALKAAGAKVWAQDKESSVIYGMPMEVAKAGLADAVMSLDELASCLLRCVR
ncbi:MAG: protein-glutamate methylesterase/protein-glutamine glutaminase [Pseudomonadota bacterium]